MDKASLIMYNQYSDDRIGIYAGKCFRGIFDETSSLADAREVLFGCDAYYGDTCDLAYEAKNKGIPVMLQNIEI